MHSIFSHGRMGTKMKNDLKRSVSMLLLLIFLFTSVYGTLAIAAAGEEDAAADDGIPTVRVDLPQWEWNKIFVIGPDGSYRDLASLVANPGDELELYVVMDNVPAAEGKEIPDSLAYGFWWNSGDWPTNNWAHVEGQAPTTWVLTTTITVEKDMPSPVNLAKNSYVPTDTLTISVVDLPADREFDTIYVDIGSGQFVKNTSDRARALRVRPGSVSVEALLVGVKNMNGSVPDTNGGTGSGFWGDAWTQNWTCINTLKGMWLATATLWTQTSTTNPATPYTVNLAKDGDPYADVAYLAAADMGFCIKTDNGDLVIIDPYVPYVLPLGETLSVYAMSSFDFHNDYSVSLSNDSVLDMSGEWSADGRIWNATLTAKQVGECALIKSIWGMTGPELIVKVLEEAPDYEADKLYVKTAESNTFEKLNPVELKLAETGEATFEICALLKSPNLGNDGRPVTVPPSGSGLWVDQSNISLSDIRWTEYLGDLWLLSATVTITDGGRYTVNLAKNGSSNADVQNVVVTYADGYMQIDNIIIGNKDYDDIGINTATRMLSGNFGKNAASNRYTVYVGETLDLSVVSDLDTEGLSFVYEGTGLEQQSGEGVSVQYLGTEPGTCEIKLMRGDELLETFYIQVRNPIYVETALGKYHKDVVHEYVRTALPTLPTTRPDLLLTAPDLTALYVKNCPEYPYEMVVGDTVVLSGYDAISIAGNAVEFLPMTASAGDTGSVKLRAGRPGTATVTFGGETFYIRVVQDAMVNHFDLEVADGGVYTIREIATYTEKRRLIIETYYLAKIVAINRCTVYLKDGSTVVLGSDEYWARHYENDTQYEFTSAYLTKNGRLVDAQGNDITDAVEQGLMDPVVATRNVPRSQIDKVVFDADLELEYVDQSRVMETESGRYELEPEVPDTVLERSVTVEMDDRDLLDARNKCPFTNGADFAINGFEENINVYGHLTVTKEVDNREVDLTKDFHFTINLTDPDGQPLVEKYSYCYVVDGVDGEIVGELGHGDSFTLRHGQTIKIDKIPSGTRYEIVEEPVPGYKVIQEGVIGYIESEQIKDAGFVNEYEPGKLTVKKTVTGRDGDQSMAFTFTVTLYDADDKVLTEINGIYGGMTFVNGVATFTLTHGQEITGEELPAGVKYVVKEEAVDGYTTSYTGETGKIVKDETVVVEITNERDTGDLTVSKLVSGRDGDTEMYFNFTVTLDDKSINGVYGDMEFKNGIAVFSLKHGESATAEGLPTGIKYTVEEEAAEGYAITYSGETGTIEKDVTKEAVVTNTREVGDLTVTKLVTGRDGDKEMAFNFTVTLDDDSINGIYGDMDFKGGIATFTLTHGEFKTAEGLPTGIKYTVKEEAVNGYTATYTGETGTIVKGKTGVAVFTNDRDTGVLTVSKTVRGRDGDWEKPFNFTVTLDDKSINGTYGDMTFTNGVATFTLTNGDSKTADELPTGIKYTVVEEDAEGYTTTYTGETGTIEKGVPKTASFINTRDTGDLTVSKKVTGRDGDEEKEFTFTITLDDTSINGAYGHMFFENGVATIKLTSGDSKTATGLPTGIKYTVKEEAAEGYTATYTGETGKIEKDQEKVAAFINDRDTGDLTVSKKVTGRDGDEEKEFTFTVTLVGEPINGTYGDMTFTNGVATFTLTSGDSKTATGLPTGLTYTVKEEAAEGYTASYTGETGKIEKDQKKVAAFINDRDTGDLTVSKKVTGRDGDEEKEFTFTVTLVGEPINGTYGDMTFTNGVAIITLTSGDSKTATGLPTGLTYTVEEAAAEGYTASYTGETGTIEKDQEKVAAFTNDRDTGNLTVSKEVTGKDGDTEKEFTFTVTLDDESINGEYGEMTFENGVATITLKHGESKTAEGLPTGLTYTVEEADDESYTASTDGATGVIEKDVTSEVKFTNDRDTGNLTVSKEVTGKDGDTEKEFTFTITLDDENINGEYGDMTFENGVATITLKHGESKTATGLPTGLTYKVEETAVEGYTTTVTGETGTIEKGLEKTAAFTNDRDTGSLTVSKEVTGKDGDTEKEFTFTVTLDDENINGTYGDMTFENGVATITLKHGESKTAEGLPTGLTYKVEEAAAEGYTATSTGATGKIEKDVTGEAKFTNDRDTGNLTVSKEVTGKDGEKDKAFTFTVTLDDTSINGTYGDMTFKNGVATITLKHGESKTATGLPTGLTYKVEEAAAEGYTATSTGATGKIEAGKTATAKFTNDRELPPPAPETGDNSHTFAWLFAVIASLIGIVLTLRSFKKRGMAQ